MTRLVLWILTIIMLPIVSLGIVAGETDITFLGVAAVVFTIFAFHMYSFFKCGVFYTDTEIVERTFSGERRMAIKDITAISLDAAISMSYVSTNIGLRDSSFGLSNEVPTNVWGMLTYTPAGEMQLRTTRMLLTKRKAHRFAQELVSVVRAAGNFEARVVLVAVEEFAGTDPGPYDHQRISFWKGFTEYDNRTVQL